MSLKSANLKIFGKVQGVSFRYFSKKKAEELGLDGWTKNADDGTVEIAVEGEETAIAKFLDWCFAGPPGAEVTKVEVEWRETAEGFDEFMVK